jgi:AraC family carnitine catabolism transcriptional activator
MLSAPPNDRPTRLAYLLLPQFSLMAFSAACEPLRAANQLSGNALYDWILVSADGEPVTSSSGLVSLVHHALADTPKVDLVVVCASFTPRAAATPPVLAWLRRLASHGTYLAGIDTGSEVLAAGGLLDGYRATVHWEHLEAFTTDFPKVEATQDLYVIDRRRFSAAGATACLDLMLYVIRSQHGPELATSVADWFIYSRIRPAEEAQRMPLRDRLAAGNPRLLQAVSLMEGAIEEPISTAELARRVGISTRELERLFQRWLRSTPSAYYRRMRLERARALLRQTDISITDVAFACGFGSIASFSRSYKACYGHSPSAGRFGPR